MVVGVVPAKTTTTHTRIRAHALTHTRMHTHTLATADTLMILNIKFSGTLSGKNENGFYKNIVVVMTYL